MSPRRALPVLAAMVVAGFVLLGVAWHGAEHAVYVPLQAPWVISGGLGGLALIGLAVAAWSIDLARRGDAKHSTQWDEFTQELVEVLSNREVRAAPRARRRAR